MSYAPFCNTVNTQACKGKQKGVNKYAVMCTFLHNVNKKTNQMFLLFAKLADVGPGEEGKPFTSTAEAKLQEKWR